jgi:hypothetical protein
MFFDLYIFIDSQNITNYVHSICLVWLVNVKFVFISSEVTALSHLGRAELKFVNKQTKAAVSHSRTFIFAETVQRKDVGELADDTTS